MEEGYWGSKNREVRERKRNEASFFLPASSAWPVSQESSNPQAATNQSQRVYISDEVLLRISHSTWVSKLRPLHKLNWPSVLDFYIQYIKQKSFWEKCYFIGIGGRKLRPFVNTYGFNLGLNKGKCHFIIYFISWQPRYHLKAFIVIIAIISYNSDTWKLS